MRNPVEFEKLGTAHRGLLFDKYFSLEGKNEKDGHLSKWQALGRAGLTPGAYSKAFKRWQELTASWPNAARFTGTVRGRLAIGLGIENVHEIGCRLHSVYGIPLIPGSSLKGMIRSRLKSLPRYSEHVADLFGTEHIKGAVEVHDAWWVPEPNRSGIALDVITVHHQSYYNGGKTPPNDRESPVPNHFLTFTGSFYFVLQTPGNGWTEFVTQATQEFLARYGVGAKKTSGYGRFLFPKSQ